VAVRGRGCGGVRHLIVFVCRRVVRDRGHRVGVVVAVPTPPPLPTPPPPRGSSRARIRSPVAYRDGGGWVRLLGGAVVSAGAGIWWLRG